MAQVQSLPSANNVDSTTNKNHPQSGKYYSDSTQDDSHSLIANLSEQTNQNNLKDKKGVTMTKRTKGTKDFEVESGFEEYCPFCPGLQTVIKAWDALPAAVRSGIVAIVEGAVHETNED